MGYPDTPWRDAEGHSTRREVSKIEHIVAKRSMPSQKKKKKLSLVL